MSLTDEERGQIKRLIKQAKYPVRQVTLCCQLYAANWEDVLECLPEGFEWIRKYQGPSRGIKARNFTEAQKLDICRRYMSGDAKRLKVEYGISGDTLRTYVAEWKGLFPNEVWPGRTNDFTRRCCLEWLAGGSSREIADRMCTSVNSARGRMRSYMKHHPDEFVGVEDKRGRK